MRAINVKDFRKMIDVRFEQRHVMLFRDARGRKRIPELRCTRNKTHEHEKLLTMRFAQDTAAR